MLVKFKGICFGCFRDSNIVDPVDVESQVKVCTPKESSSVVQFKTENDTTVTQNVFLTTAEDETVFKGPKLKLVAFEGGVIGQNKEFLINGKGLEFGGRKKADCFVYIGRTLLAKNTHVIINDIALDDPEVGEKHAMIRYNQNLKKYFIKDQGQGSGTFLKVEKPTKIHSGSIVSFSDSHMLVNILQQKQKEVGDINKENQEDDVKDILMIKFLDGPKAKEIFKFSPDNGIVKVGRANDCQIKFEGNSLSRYQCSLKYVENSWFICDGIDGKESTNGTWIFAENFNEVTDGLVIKIGKTLFKAYLEP